MTNRYIVLFNPSFEKNSHIAVLKRHNAKIRFLFELIPAAAIESMPDEARLMKTEPQIKKILPDILSAESKPIAFKFLEPDSGPIRYIRYFVPKDYDYEVDMAQRQLEKKDVSSSETIGIIDSGVDNQHPILLDRVIKEYDLTGEGIADLNGHGTTVASIFVVSILNSRRSVSEVLSEMNLQDDSFIDRKIEIISVKVANSKGVFWESDVMAGIELLNKEAAERKRIIVVNLSLGIYQPNCTGKCPLCSLANKATNLMINAAAGNRQKTGSTFSDCPAKAERVIGVGAVDSSGKIAQYSRSGDLYMPGDVEFKVI